MPSLLAPAFLLSLLLAASSIYQPCESDANCPDNSSCNPEAQVCRCHEGFIGSCNISAAALTDTAQTYFLNGSSISYFYITPVERNKFIRISVSICEEELQPITLYFWGETGFETHFSPATTFVPPLYREFEQNCSQLTFPEFYFYSQRNGDSERLIIGIQSEAADLPLRMAAEQKVSYAIYISYYLAVSVMALLLLSFCGSMLVAIFRRRRVPALPTRHQPEEDNNIDHFEEYLPSFKFQPGGERLECPICLQLLEHNEPARKTPCEHTFHSACLDSWCVKNVNCPVCRHDLAYEFVRAIKESLRARPGNKEKYMRDWEESIEMETVSKDSCEVREEML